MNVIILALIYMGSALMVVNIYQYIKYARFVQEAGIWSKENVIALYFPILLLVLFLGGYLAVAIFGAPDIIMAAILFGGSIFVFVVFLLLQRITSIILEQEKIKARLVAVEESSRIKDSFLSSMSHEMRTPMNAIIGLCILALANPDLPDETRRQIGKINDSAANMMSMIENILEISHYESKKTDLDMKPFQIHAALESVNKMIQNQCSAKGLEYTYREIGSFNDYYVGDSMKLKQMLLSVLDNAVKFTDAPGRVTFTVEQMEEDNGDGGSLFRFEVSDTGIGMSEEFLSQAFEAFTQEDASIRSRFGGSGLGLAIARHDVELMQGKISVVSQKGQGSTFTIIVCLGRSDLTVQEAKAETETGSAGAGAGNAETGSTGTGTGNVEAAIGKAECGRGNINVSDLTKDSEGVGYETESRGALPEGPGIETGGLGSGTKDSGPGSTGSVKAGATAAEEENETVDFSSVSLEGRHVLIVEDIELNAEILEDLLDMEDITVEIAENGQVAVDMFCNNPPGHFDAILMDLRMPVMDGLEATRVIRSQEREDAKTIPIIALTANAFKDDKINALESGMDEYMSKPVNYDQLFNVLRRALA